MAAAAAPETMKKPTKPQSVGIYSKILITRKVPLNIIHVGSNIKQTLEKVIASEIEGKCIVEGYIKPNSTKILTYSSGEISGINVIFEVVFEPIKEANLCRLVFLFWRERFCLFT